MLVPPTGAGRLIGLPFGLRVLPHRPLFVAALVSPTALAPPFTHPSTLLPRSGPPSSAIHHRCIEPISVNGFLYGKSRLLLCLASFASCSLLTRRLSIHSFVVAQDHQETAWKVFAVSPPHQKPAISVQHAFFIMLLLQLSRSSCCSRSVTDKCLLVVAIVIIGCIQADSIGSPASSLCLRSRLLYVS